MQITPFEIFSLVFLSFIIGWFGSKVYKRHLANKMRRDAIERMRRQIINLEIDIQPIILLKKDSKSKKNVHKARKNHKG